MKPSIRSASIAFTFGLLAWSAQVSPAAAQQDQGMSADQQAMMAAWMQAMTPGAPHKELASRAGKWTAKMTMWMEPGAPPTESTGSVEREVVLGGRVLAEKFRADFMGMPMEGYGMTGYDNITGTYWSTWNDNMSTGLMHSEGKAASDGTVTFTGKMMDPMTKQAIPLRIVTAMPSADRDTMEMYETRDGQERKTMAIVYERVK